MSSEIPSQFTHSVKFEETAKGVRISIHVHANSGALARNEALLLYLRTREDCVQDDIPLAPMEISK